MINIENAKNKLKKNGYTSFDLSEFDSGFYNKLLPIKCNETNNIKKYITHVRADITYANGNGEKYDSVSTNYRTFENAFEKKEELYNHILETNKKDITESKKLVASQIWYFSDANRIYPICNMSSNEYLEYIKKIMMYFYDFKESQEYSILDFITYYDRGCVLKPHSDGTGTGRVCALLIYLNDKYDENDGGILILDKKEKVIPTFGKVAIIDLQNFDIEHEVTEVVSGLGRFALLAFVTKK